MGNARIKENKGNYSTLFVFVHTDNKISYVNMSAFTLQKIKVSYLFFLFHFFRSSYLAFFISAQASKVIEGAEEFLQICNKVLKNVVSGKIFFFAIVSFMSNI